MFSDEVFFFSRFSVSLFGMTSVEGNGMLRRSAFSPSRPRFFRPRSRRRRCASCFLLVFFHSKKARREEREHSTHYRHDRRR